MASGKTHARIAGVVAVGTAVASPWIVAEYGADAAVGAVAGALMGYMVTPDADINSRTHDEWRMIRNVPILGRLWVAYWAAYGELFTHRGISHAPILGTLSRALYAFWWVALMPWQYTIDAGGAVLAMFIAWCVQDVAHLAADGWRFKWIL